jgi:hypothetical protein
MDRERILKTTGILLLAMGAAAAVAALIVRDQIERHRRDLFSSSVLQRLAALGYIAGLGASVDLVHLLRDFVSWEPRSMLRRRALQIIARMERQLGAAGATGTPPEFAG